MARQQPPQVDPNQLAGYRQVPGFRKVSFFNPETGEHRSSRRYYNPMYPTTDPRYEISEYQYRQLRKQADQEQLYEMARRNEMRERQRIQREQQVRRIAQEQQVSVARARDLHDQLRIMTYQLNSMPVFSEQAQQLRRPGGEMAQILEALGYRERGAPYPVGDSPQGARLSTFGYRSSRNAA